jgi:hypothetical protein
MTPPTQKDEKRELTGDEYVKIVEDLTPFPPHPTTVDNTSQAEWRKKLAKMYCECTEGEKSDYEKHSAACPVIQGQFTHFQTLTSFIQFEIEKAVLEERERLKQSVELWMNTHDRTSQTWETDDFIKFCTEEV